MHVNTPSGSGGVDTSGEELRVDVLPSDEAAVFTNLGIQAFASGPGMSGVNIPAGQALELIGSNPVIPQWLQPASPDDLDLWSRQRDEQVAASASSRYVSPEIPGAYELDAAGSWMPDTEYGPIWFPRNVPPGWAPYDNGHWVNHAPWGWVWVEDEPWGYAPFHYGRWVSFEGRWGWVPGPPAAHPVWSPALVVFAGGIHIGGVGISAWFPLGPGEPYHPWYHASPRYIDDVNISNIRESRRVHVQNTYVNINVVNVNYVNRTNGVSAMRHEDFAAGRSARQAPVVVNTNVIQNIQVIERPEVQPPAHPFAGHPPARPVQVSVESPALINDQGKLVSARPGAQPVAPPVRPSPTIRALPGRYVVAPPPGARPQAMPPAAPAAPAAKPTPVPAPAAPPAYNPGNRPGDRGGRPPVAAPPEQAPVPPARPAQPTPPAPRPARPAPPVPMPAARPAPPPPPPAARPAPPPPPPPPAGVRPHDKKDEKSK
jgi:hypothetical protein